QVRRKAVQQGKRKSTRLDFPEAGVASPQLDLVTPSPCTSNTPTSSVHSSSSSEDLPEALSTQPSCPGDAELVGVSEAGHGDLLSKSSNTTVSSSPPNDSSFTVGRETTLDCVTRDLMPILMKSHTVMLSRTCDKSARFVRSGTMADDESVESDDTQSDGEAAPLPEPAGPPRKSVRLCIPENEVSAPRNLELEQPEGGEASALTQCLHVHA
ncbi:hypothetical protein FOZ63_029625, partial [Perkinsus olseni]